MGMGNPVETNGSIPFLEHLLKNTQGHLTSLKMSELNITELTVDSARRLTSILEKFHFVSIHLSYEGTPAAFSAFAAQRINIQELQLRLKEPSNVSGNHKAYFQPQENFLSASSQHLESLDLLVHLDSGECEIPWNFPWNGFQRLKQLSLIFFSPDVDSWDKGAFSQVLFERLGSKHFPALKKVSIGSDDGYEDYPYEDNGGDYEMSLFDCCPQASFPSVTEVKLERISTFKLKDDWSKVFPNLKKLTTTILNTHRSFERILSNKNLEYVDLIIVVLKGPGFVENVNALLSARATPKDLSDHSKPASEEEMSKYRDLLYLPSLFQLTSECSLFLLIDPVMN